jgi:hypothetical protein
LADKQSNERDVQDVPGLATLIIPEDLAQRVVEHIATLEHGDTDVSGYMMNLGLNLGRLAEQTQTVTNCKDTGGGKDQLCDSDTWITK